MHTEFEKKKLFTINQYEQEREYWIAHLSGEIIKAGFPVNNESHGPWSPKFETLDFRFPAPLFDRLMTIINHSDSRLNVTLVLGITLLLYKYTGNKDIIVGIPIEKQEIDGQFINTVLPIRSRIDDQRNVKEFLMQVKQTIIDAEKNQNYPIETIPFELGLPMTDGPFPLFDTAVLLRNIHDKRYLGNIKLNMLFSFLRTENALEGTIEYNAMVFDRLIVEQLVTHFLHVMQEAFFHVDMKLVDVPLLTEDEKKAMIFAFNKTDQDYPRDKMIHQLVEEQVERTPEHIAVESQGKRVTYRELNENANRLARVLREKGAVADTVTAILLDRSEDVPLAFLAVLKAGGAYLPIGNEYPEDRIDYILTDSRAKLRLMHRSRSEGKNSGLPVLYLDDATSFASGAENLEPVNTVNSLAYIIYTSGTTGRPKGVMIEHRGLVNYISWAARTYVGDEKNEKNETSNKVDFALYTSISFDLTVTSVFTPLVTGNTMIAYGGIDKKLYIDDVIDDNRVGVLKLTPSHLKLIRSKKVGNSSIKRLIVGGEELETELAREIYQNFDRKIDIYNEYGPTETVVGSMIYRFDPLTDTRHAVPIGVPIANTQIYILNEYLQPVPVGVAGELYIGGDGLARGYLFNPEMTEAKFVPDPFIPGRKMYKTGDLAVRLTDGMIEYKGRIDHQVKIRGYRVETGEIEVKIIDYLKTKTVQPGSVKIECVITDIKDEMGEKTLCAYICSETAFNIAELKDALGRELPDYMIPTYYVKLDEIPLASSGKVDRKSLPKPKLSLEEGYIAPRNGVEEKLVQVWSEVLDIETEKIGIDANFFEVGGHSLKATFLTAGIQRHFSVKLPLVKIFEKPTIRGQAELLKDAVREIFIAIDRVEEKEYYVLSSAQRRLYILQQMDPNAVAYNVSVIVELEGDIEKKKLEETFRQLADRHESLKTAIISVNGMPVQTIAQAFRIDIAYFDSDSPLRTEEAIRNFKRPFDLSQAPLMRVGLITIDRMRHVLMVELHHLITDGISQDLLVNDFMCLYKDIQLPGLKLQYKDYSEWQQRESFRESIRKQEAFWVTECEDEIPLLNLPVDYKRPLVQSVEGDTLRFEIGKDDTAALNAIAQRENATLFMVLLAVYQVFLSKICGQENIIVGTPIAGRRHADLEKIVGMFVNTLALRAVPSGEKTFNDFLDEVRTTTFNAFENQDYQFEELVDRIAIKRDLSRNPIFDTLFVLQNTFKPSGDALDKEFVGLKVKPYVYGNKTSKFDLSLIAFEHEGTLHFNFEYCTRIFKAETIVRFIACFKKVVETVIQDGNTRISEIEIISEAEREQVLYRFNDPASDYPSDKTIHQLFEEQVERTPDQNALSALSPTPRQLTYNELNAWSDQLAQELVEKGVQPNTIVAIRMERSIEMIVCILGILKAGGAYLPIDPQAPEDRVNYMLTDSGARLVLATEVTEDTEKGVIEVKKLRSSEGKKGPAGAHIGAPLQREIHVGADPRVCPSASFLPASGNRQPATSLAYIIYTSGSTGRPKGVPISHANLSPLLHWGYKELGLGSSDRALQNVSYYFDWSVWEIFIMLTTGGSLYPVPGELLLNPEACITFIRENGMTVLHATPSQYQYFMDTGQKLDTLNYLFLGAEKLAVDFLRRSFESVNDNCRVFNMYGPTEATIISAVLEIERGTESRFETLSSVPIGRGVGNTHLFVWDRYLNLCPVNVAGELYISGDGVSAGYLNNPELTAEKFTGSRWPVAGSFNPTPKNNRTPKNTNPKTKSFWSHLFSKRWAAGGID
ncbi:MAG: amino acid adenylation domain-containing protein [Candidatus Omnitrophota bacterium]